MRISLSVACILLAAPAVAQTQVTLVAEDSKSISPSGQNWNDNRVRAYWSSSIGFADGFMRFDVSSIPDQAALVSLTLRVYHEAGFGNPYANPAVDLYRVGDDSWQRGATDPHPGFTHDLNYTSVTGFPTGDLVPVDFVADPVLLLFMGTQDLLDDKLSLAIRNEAGSQGVYSYVYFYGSDTSPAPPELILEYTITPNLMLVGSCGSFANLRGEQFTPGGVVHVGYSFSPGNSVLSFGSCPQLSVPVAAPVTYLGTEIASASGTWGIARNIPASACGNVWIVALDVATCTVTAPFGL